MLPILIPILTKLAESGLSILGNAILAKGKDEIERRIGVDIDSTMQTEDGKIRLLQLQQEHEEFLIAANAQAKEEDLKVQAMENANTASARDMNTRVNESVNASWLSKNIAAMLAITVVSIGFFLLATTDAADVRTAVVGLMTLVLGFYFGSTSSSKGKDELISKLSAGSTK
jgi:ABC-type multidrug transport system fused ATPase/permease subunit